MAGQHQHQQEAPPASQHQVSQVLQGRQRQGLSSVGQHPYLTVTVIYTVIYIVIVSITDIVTTTSQQREPQIVFSESSEIQTKSIPISLLKKIFDCFNCESQFSVLYYCLEIMEFELSLFSRSYLETNL